MTGWFDQAACRGMGPDLFYPTEREDRRVDMRNWARTVYADARKICVSCPVRLDCLDDALQTGDVHYGMRGGMSPTDRRRLLTPAAEHTQRAQRDRVNRRANRTISHAARQLMEGMQ